MRTGDTRLVRALAGLLVMVLAGVSAVQAQRIWGGYYGRTPPKFPSPTTFEGSFHFCRILFTSDRREKQGWDTDYPGADINFSVRLAELTKVRVKFVEEGGEGEVPDAVVEHLERTARERGAEPEDWWCCPGAIPRSRWRSVEHWHPARG